MTSCSILLAVLVTSSGFEVSERAPQNVNLATLLGPVVSLTIIVIVLVIILAIIIFFVLR